MTAFLNEIMRLLEKTIGRSETTVELILCSILGLAAFGLTLYHTGRMNKFPMISSSRTLGSMAITLILLAFAAAGSNLYLVPRLSNAALRPWIPLIAAGLVFLAVIVPVVTFLYRSKYFKILSTMVLSLIASAAVIALAHGGFNAIRSSAGQFDKTKDRTEAVKEIL